MKRKAFDWDIEGYPRALCSCEGGGDGGGVGPGTGRNEANPAGNQGKGKGKGTSAGTSQGGGQRSTGNRNQPGSKSGMRSASLGVRSRGSRNPGGISGNTPSRSTGSPTQPGTNPAVPQSYDFTTEDATLSNTYDMDDMNQVVDPDKVGKIGKKAPVESVAVTAPPNTPQDQRNRTRGRRSTGNPNQPGKTRGVAVAPGAQDARNVPKSLLAGYLGLDEDSRQANLNYDPFDTPDPAGGEHTMLEEEKRKKKEAEDAQEQDETAAEAESESGTEAPAYSDGGGSSGSGSSSGSGMVTATADGPTVAGLLQMILDQGNTSTTPATGVEATPSYGLEDTRITKRPLTDPNLRTSALTNLGTRNMGTANPVVDPVTGSIYANPSAARSAGITNWVYKYVYDSKTSGSSLYSAVIG